MIRKIKCLLGFHSPKEIGRAQHPLYSHKTILAMGCRYCGKKLKRAYIVDSDMLDSPIFSLTHQKDMQKRIDKIITRLIDPI